MSKDDIRRHFPLLSHLERQGVKVRGQGKQRTANRCPLKQHGNDHWCVSINVEEELFNCHSCECKGSVVEWMALEQGRSAEDVFKELTASVNGNGNGNPRNNGHESGKPQIVQTYDYKDQHDELVYQVVRYEPKSFRQRRPDPVDGSWHWNMDGVTRIPYHLPAVLESDTVVIVEGEKDADNMETLGYAATTSVGGANNWLASYAEYFRGKSVILVPDNDEAGKEYAKDVIASLEDKVLSVKEAHVPEPHKDASDWIETFSDPIAARLAFDELFDRAPMAVKPPPLYTLEELAKRYSLMVNNSETRMFSLGKFLPSLGGNVRSLMPGDLVAVMAGTAVGKTALMQGMAKAADPLATLFFELELPEELMFERFVQMERGWYAYEVEAAFRADPEWYLCQHLSHILVCPESGLSTEQIEKYIQRSELKFGTPPTVVFVDYVGLVQSGVSRSRYEAVSYAAEQLKVIAKKTETIIIMGTQIHRPTKDGSSLEVDLHDAKDSGSIENSAGLVIGAWRPDQDHITLRILKNTKGSSGQDINCGFDGAKMQIWEESKISQEDLPQQPSYEPAQAELPVET